MIPVSEKLLSPNDSVIRFPHELLADHWSLPVSNYSKKEIVAAGKMLREKLPMLTEEPSERVAELLERNRFDYADCFRIAHSWRDAHMRPLLRVRQEMGGRIRTIERGAISAARLKRMAAIRRKLQRPITLYQMQDIAGCRAIFRSMKEVNRLTDFYFSGGSKHKIQDHDDYVTNPKADGYRGRHIILKFCGDGEDAIYNRQTVEIQIRTKLQHSWATAVEAVGLIREQNYKNGEGDHASIF